MRSLSSLLCSAFAMALTAAAFAAQPYRISGTVLDSVTHAPVAHCRVLASKEDEEGTGFGRFENNDSIGVETDASGRFSLVLPSAGRWRLTGSAPGYRAQSYEQHEGLFSAIVLTPADPSLTVTFRLTPNADITGFVLDEAGEAIRGGRVMALRVPEKGLGQVPQPSRVVGNTQTDDRGHYEFANLPPGHYEVGVDAQPWYAIAARRDRGRGAMDADSPLDVVYPFTWFPGVTDASDASILTLKGGESHEADLRLLPVPSTHLLIPGPPGQRSGLLPQVQQVSPAGGIRFQSVHYAFTPEGIEIDGLGPGTYRVINPREDGGDSSLLQIGKESRTVSLSSATPAASVALSFDLPEGAPEPRVEFIDAETGRPAFENFAIQLRGGFFRRSSLERQQGDGMRFPPRLQRDRPISLPPGRYMVLLSGQRDEFLRGMTATGGTVRGRFLTVQSGAEVKLTLHIEAGRADLSGKALQGQRPSPGTLVLLVPASLDDPAGMSTIRRAETASDGSFSLPRVIPGQYILLAVDHGWDVNWADSATLSRYLMRGTPIELKGDQKMQQTLTVQTP